MKEKYHSHYGSYSKNRYYDDLKTDKNTPTAKQKKFYAHLAGLCKEHNIDPSLGHPLRNRIDYASGINLLIERLQHHGIDVHGNGVTYGVRYSTGTDNRGRDFTETSLHRAE